MGEKELLNKTMQSTISRRAIKLFENKRFASNDYGKDCEKHFFKKRKMFFRITMPCILEHF